MCKEMKFVIVIFFTILHVLMCLFMKYSPDLFVFVNYAFVDNIEREVGFSSLVNNVFIFDLLVVIGDSLGIDNWQGWTYYIGIVYGLVFFSKYLILTLTGNLSGVALVYLASFFMDLNQLRFNIALILVGIAIWATAKTTKFILLGLSGLAHVVPPIIYIASNHVKYTIVLAIMFFSLGGLVSESRLFDYTEGIPFYLPKTLLLSLPLVLFLFKENVLGFKLNQLRNIVFFCFVIAVIFFYFNVELSARFLETGFVVATVISVYKRFNYSTQAIFVLFSLAVIFSRFVNGISNSTDFSSLYQL